MRQGTLFGSTEKRQRTASEEPESDRTESRSFLPLAARMRPESVEQFSGQPQAISFLQPFLESGSVLPSLILWGPPGCGKTTFLRLLAKFRGADYMFKSTSAVTATTPELKKILEASEKDQKTWKRATCLFIDEVHRLNRAQQDVLLPYVEHGLVLLGATTENPSFSMNGAILSRAKVVVFEQLKNDQVIELLRRAVQDPRGLNGKVEISESILERITEMVDGDVRSGLNHLEIVASLGSGSDETALEQLLQRRHVRYDKTGDQHYDLISALHKSMRGGDANASLYWVCRMLSGGEQPEYIARRLIRFASEDVGMADSGALPMAIATLGAVKQLGMPECNVHLCHCAVYLARAKKSIAVYQAMKQAMDHISRHHNEGPPLSIRNAPTDLMSSLGYGRDYSYTPNAADEQVALDANYLPDSLLDQAPFLDLSKLDERADYGQKWKKL